MSRYILIILVFMNTACKLNNEIAGLSEPDQIEPNNNIIPTHLEVSTDQLLRRIGGQDVIYVEWSSDGPEIPVSLQVSADSVSWITIETQSSLAVNFSISASNLELSDGDYELRLYTNSETINLGSINIDVTPPTLFSGGQTVGFGCFNPNDGTFQPAVDNMGGAVTYHAVGELPASLSGCLDGTSSTSCELAPVAPYWLSIDYIAIDEAGNSSEVGNLLLSYCS